MKTKIIGILSVLFFSFTFFSNVTFAHCDTLDGPVVTAAQKALESENVNLVLVWVKKDGEAELKEAFQKAVADREANPAQRDQIDMSFFEELVRIHRAGEGASFEGLKPAGAEIDSAIADADKAIETGSADSLSKELINALQNGIQKSFQEVAEKRDYNPNDVEAGREYVESYVKFIHYAEGINEAIKKQSMDHHHEEAGAMEMHSHDAHKSGADNHGGTAHEDEGVDHLKKQLYFLWAIVGVLALMMAMMTVQRTKRS